MQKPETKGTAGLVRLNQAKLRVRAINTSRPCPNTKVYALTASYTSRPFCHAPWTSMGPAFCTSPQYSPPCTAWKECWQPHKSQASPADGRTWSLASYLTFHSLSKWGRTVSAMDHRSAALPCPPSRWKTPVHHQSSPKAHSVKLWHNSSCKPQWIIKVYLKTA